MYELKFSLGGSYAVFGDLSLRQVKQALAALAQYPWRVVIVTDASGLVRFRRR